MKLHFDGFFSNSLDFYRVFKGCLNQNDCNLDVARKICYSRPS